MSGSGSVCDTALPAFERRVEEAWGEPWGERLREDLLGTVRVACSPDQFSFWDRSWFVAVLPRLASSSSFDTLAATKFESAELPLAVPDVRCSLSVNSVVTHFCTMKSRLPETRYSRSINANFKNLKSARWNSRSISSERIKCVRRFHFKV